MNRYTAQHYDLLILLSFYLLCCIALHKHYHVCICDWRNATSTTLHGSKLTFESSLAETKLQAVSQKLAKLELLHFIETVFDKASIVGYSSRLRTQYIVPHTLQYLCSVLEQCCKYNLTTDFLSCPLLDPKQCSFSFTASPVQHYSQNSSAFFHYVYIWAELCKSPHTVM